MEKQGFKITEEVITPEQAYEYLKTNAKNRNISKPKVLDYVKDMLNDKWRFTSQTITFDEDGVLIDGQHRLAAVVKSKKAQKFVVSRGGKHEEIFKVYDIGKKRTAADVLNIKGAKSYSLIAAGIKFKMQIDKGGMSGIRVTNEEVLEAYNANPNKYQEIATFANNKAKNLKLYTAGYLAGILSHLIITKGHDDNFVCAFFEELHTIGSGDDGVIYLLKKRLLESSLDKKTLLPRYKFALIIKTWNYYVSGKYAKKLQITAEEVDNIEFL